MKVKTPRFMKGSEEELRAFSSQRLEMEANGEEDNPYGEFSIDEYIEAEKNISQAKVRLGIDQ